METLFLKLNYRKEGDALGAEDRALLCRAAEILRGGGLVAFPTETVYGLGGNAIEQEASGRIYAAKGRPSDNPLIVHIADIEALYGIAEEVPERALLLARAFWPGPLTMVLKKAACIPYETTGGLDTAAVRMPSHPVARELIRLAGVPVAAPSANTSGRPSPTEARHAAEDLSGKIDAIVDGGSCGIGLESTIVDLTGEQPVLLRPGAVTREMLSEVLSEEVQMDPALSAPLDPKVRPKAPGMKYRHYAPKAKMLIVQAADGDRGKLMSTVAEEAKKALEKGLRVGILCAEESLPVYREALSGREETCVFRTAGSRLHQAELAHELFAALREMDEASVSFIVAEGVPEEALGYAIMNRMKKAAAQNVLTV